ncbi:Uncharacterized protein Fot_42069 [Forsythia ovata]|uniref:Transmembrane protein n=1 Tax=Forsythia ovata TaxID=205694 RepID=A0ABD1RK61_9LAMI
MWKLNFQRFVSILQEEHCFDWKNALLLGTLLLLMGFQSMKKKNRRERKALQHVYVRRARTLQSNAHYNSKTMSRRPNSTCRLSDSGGIPFMGSLHSKSHSSPLLSVGLLAVGALLIVGYIYHGSGSRNGDIAALSRLDDKFSRYKSSNFYVN